MQANESGEGGWNYVAPRRYADRNPVGKGQGRDGPFNTNIIVVTACDIPHEKSSAWGADLALPGGKKFNETPPNLIHSTRFRMFLLIL